jgi:hypothetical protein
MWLSYFKGLPNMRKNRLLLALVASFFISQAHADFTAKDASLATITFKNPGVCTSVVCVPVFQLYDGTNVATLTTAGADAVSNTLTGLPVYGRNLVFNGTTWDRWLGDATNGGFVNVKASVLPTGAATSGNQTSQITQETATAAALGTTTDAVGATPSTAAAASLISLAKAINNNVSSSIPAGSALIGDVNLRQGGAALSATNGLFANLLQGNAALSASNAIFAKQTDGTTVQTVDPCQGSTKSYLPITLATAAVKVIATGVAAKKIYICAIDLTNNAADSIAVFEATTATTCATSAVAVMGAGTSVATAATGYNFAANGGISKGNGGFSVGQTSVNNNDLCIAQSAGTQLTGGITYVTQ